VPPSFRRPTPVPQQGMGNFAGIDRLVQSLLSTNSRREQQRLQQERLDLSKEQEERVAQYQQEQAVRQEKLDLSQEEDDKLKRDMMLAAITSKFKREESPPQGLPTKISLGRGDTGDSIDMELPPDPATADAGSLGALDLRSLVERDPITAQLGGQEVELPFREDLQERRGEDLQQALSFNPALQAAMARLLAKDTPEDKIKFATDKAKALAALGLGPSRAGDKLTTTSGYNAERDIGKVLDRQLNEFYDARRSVGSINNALVEGRKNLEAGKTLNFTSQAILVGFQKLLDPTSVVRESEYDRSPRGQSLRNRWEGVWLKLSQGGAGVTLSELEGAVEAANTFYEGFQQEAISFADRASKQLEYNLSLRQQGDPTPEDVDSALQRAMDPRLYDIYKRSGPGDGIDPDEETGTNLEPPDAR